MKTSPSSSAFARMILAAACASSTILMPTGAFAALFFWDDGSGVDSNYATAANWDPDGVPGAGDLAVFNNGALSTIQITSNSSADSLRLSDGGAVNHTSGTFTIANGSGGDNGLWVGEFGPATSIYTLDGGVLQINDSSDGLQVGRGGAGEFNLLSGSVNATLGDTVIGLDGSATWTQSGGTFTGSGVQIGLFQSPEAGVLLSDSAIWSTGLVLLSDQSSPFPAAIRSDLTLTGSAISFSSLGLVIRSKGHLNFDALNAGFSTINLNNQQLLLNSASLSLANLPTANSLGETLVLIDGIGSYSADAAFGNAADGSTYAQGATEWTLSYGADSVFLTATAVPEPSVVGAGLLGLLGWVILARRRRQITA